jgi:hypothetical protein
MNQTSKTALIVTMCDANWQPIASAPFELDLELAVIEDGEIHRLIVRCQRTTFGWRDAATGSRIDVHPTHWRH